MRIFFFDSFLPLVGPLPAGGYKVFSNRSVYHKSVLMMNVDKSTPSYFKTVDVVLVLI